jgi:hypothetical protein
VDIEFALFPDGTSADLTDSARDVLLSLMEQVTLTEYEYVDRTNTQPSSMEQVAFDIVGTDPFSEGFTLDGVDMETIYSIANCFDQVSRYYPDSYLEDWTYRIDGLDLVAEFTKMASDISGATPADVAAVIPDWTPLIGLMNEWAVTIISNLEWTGYDYTMTAFDSDGLGTTIMDTLS